MLQIPELLSPAGDLERLRYAINYGADAVYCSLPEFGMRSAPANFTPEQLTEGVIYAHARGRKVYLTMNTLPTNEEADRLPDAIRSAAAAGVDAFIVADLGVLEACKQFAPDIDVHMSTQTGITNWAAARAAYNLGARRVVLARELTLQDIATIRDKTPPELEIEAFVHGAMCMSVSGRCLLSNYLTGRDSNRGQCAQPCRWKYYLSEETRPGQLYEIGENEDGSYILNANDMCTAPFLDLICKAGVDSLKIEGRAKTFYYVASVTAAYRRALDQYLADPMNDNFELPDEVLAELTRTSHRHYSPGFYFGREQAKGKLTVIAHVGCNNTADSAELARHAESVGVDAIASIPPIYFHLPEYAIAKYWNDMSAAAPNTEFVIYNIPQLAGTALTMSLLKEMLKNPNVVAVKNSSMPTQDIQMFKDAGIAARGEGNFVVFNGPDEQFVSGRVIGADGGIGGTYAVMPELYLAMNDHINKGEIKEAQAIQYDADRIIYKMCEAHGNLYAVQKEILRRMYGLELGGVREPMPGLIPEDEPIVAEAQAMIEAAIAKL